MKQYDMIATETGWVAEGMDRIEQIEWERARKKRLGTIGVIMFGLSPIISLLIPVLATIFWKLTDTGFAVFGITGIALMIIGAVIMFKYMVMEVHKNNYMLTVQGFKAFEDYLLPHLCTILNLDPQRVEDLSWAIGEEKAHKGTYLDILVEVNMVESRSRFRKNPQQVTVNGQKIEPSSTPIGNVFVLTIGKGSSFNGRVIKIIQDEEAKN